MDVSKDWRINGLTFQRIDVSVDIHLIEWTFGVFNGLAFQRIDVSMGWYFIESMHHGIRVSVEWHFNGFMVLD